ncbi:glycoside hydrolase family 29 protein [Ramaria rubella]|nr:glycoside hydrolase family 29 protein [Ramaria rubella]
MHTSLGSLPPKQHGREKLRTLLELQQSFLDLRFGMFIHFNMATFQNLEWGDPRGPGSLFNPTALDTDQWVSAAKDAGMTYACLTTKHHDGFAIWPTRTGGAGVKNVDVVRAYVDSCRKGGLKVGLYYSILDLRADIRKFCITAEKVGLIKAQLTELLTDYGTIDLLIFDGWNAPWSRITYEDLPFDDIYHYVKTLQPDCLVMDLNASEFPASALYYSDIKAFESNAGQTLPERNIIPAQCCHTLTDEWFWKQGDETRALKSSKRVIQEWLVPQNERFCNLLLNAAPTREGRLAPNVVARLKEIGKKWRHPGPSKQVQPSINIITRNLALRQPIFASASQATFGPDLANDGVLSHSWCLPPNEHSGWLEVDLTTHEQGPKPVAFNTLVLTEPVGRWNNYRQSRISHYRFMALFGEKWVEIVSPNHSTKAKGEDRQVYTHRIQRVSATKVRLEVEGKETEPEPHVVEVGVYDEP